MQGNSRKGPGRCRLSCLCSEGEIDSVYSVTNRSDDISQTLFVNSPVYYLHCPINLDFLTFVNAAPLSLDLTGYIRISVYTYVLYTLSIYPSVHKQLIRTLFEAHSMVVYCYMLPTAPH